MKIGDTIQVIDRSVYQFPIVGTVLELDEHPFGDSYAKIAIHGPSLTTNERWVNIRLAHVVASAPGEAGKEQG